MLTPRLAISDLRRIGALLRALNLVEATAAANSWNVSSPSGRLQMKVEASDGIWYSITTNGEQVITSSQIDLKVQAVG
jgi:hypothetical protein